MNLRNMRELYWVGISEGSFKGEIKWKLLSEKNKKQKWWLIKGEGYFHETGFCKVGGGTYNYNIYAPLVLLINMISKDYFLFPFSFHFRGGNFVATWDSAWSGFDDI